MPGYKTTTNKLSSHTLSVSSLSQTALEPVVREYIYYFSMFDFLWKDDMVCFYNDFVQNDPNPESINQEVEYLLKIEAKVKAIPDVIPVGPIQLNTEPVKNALSGFAIAWKTQYVSALHDEAKVRSTVDALPYAIFTSWIQLL